MLDRGGDFSFRKGEMLREVSLQHCKRRAQTGNCSIMSIHQKKLHCSIMYLYCSVKTAPVWPASSSTALITVLLKYLMKYGLTRHLSSKKELVNAFCFLLEVRLFCKYLAEVVADAIALT